MKTLFLFLLIWCSSVFAQNDSLFNVCNNRNFITFPENISHFSWSPKNRDSLSGKPARIMQIGDSHVQISQFSTAFAATIDSIFIPFAEKSFWFPYAMLGGYTPKGFTISCDGAIAEKMVTATDEKRFTITGHALKIPEGKNLLTISCVKNQFREIEMIVEKNPNWNFSCENGKVETKAISENLEVVTLSLASEVDSVQLNVDINQANAGQLRIYGFREKVPNSRMEFEFYGSSGAKFSDYVQNSDFLADYISEKQPELFIVSLGTNDSYLYQQSFVFKRRIKKLLKTIRQNSPADILFTLPPNTCYKEEIPRSEMKVRKVIYRVAKRQNCALWDFYQIMGGENSMKEWRKLGLTSADLLHLNKSGYELQGRLLAEALIRFNLYQVVLK